MKIFGFFAVASVFAQNGDDSATPDLANQDQVSYEKNFKISENYIVYFIKFLTYTVGTISSIN